MNKKFFSAVLMGALLLGGTFVSCQDYDDDIDNLQEQINKLASADQLSSKVSELQSAISAAQSAAEAKAATAQAAADAAKTAAGNAASKDDVKAAQAAAQEYADGLKSYADDAAAKAAQKVADQLAGAATMEDVNKAIEKALEDYKSLLGLADELKDLQDAIAKAVTEDQLKSLADRVAALEEAGIPGVAAAVASISAPAPAIDALRTWANWDAKKHAEGASAARFAALKAVFAEEIAKLDEDGKPHDQGGFVPVLVNPSNVDLTDGYNAYLQTVDGKMAEVNVEKVVKGLPAGSKIDGITLKTKAAAEDNLWSVKVVPSKNKYNQYDNVANAALVLEDAEGVAFKTPFVYTYTSKKANDVKITPSTTAKMVNGEVDVFAAEAPEKPVFQLENEANGIFLLSVENKADYARYGIGTTKDGKITFSKFPTDKGSIEIHDVKLIALGLNGSTAESTIKKLEVVKTIGGATPLSDTIVALSVKAGAVHQIRWNKAELEMDEAGWEDVLTAIAAENAEVTLLKPDDASWVAPTVKLSAYRANGLKATAYENFVTFGFDIEAKDFAPADYPVEIKIGSIFKGQATITTVYPTSGLIEIHEKLMDKGVLQITGTPNDKYDEEGKITYDMTAAFKLADDVTIEEIIDLDNDEEWNTTVKTEVTGPKDQVGYDHNFSVKYNYGGESYEMEFKAALVSPFYFADGKDAVTLEAAANRTATFDVTNKNTIDLMKVIKGNEGKYAAGYQRGQTYKLFIQGADGGSKDTTITYTVPNYASPVTVSGAGTGTSGTPVDYLVNKNNGVLVYSGANYATYATVWGWNDGTNATSHKVTKNDFDGAYSVVSQWYEQDTTSTTGAYKQKKIFVFMDNTGDDKTYKIHDIASPVNSTYNTVFFALERNTAGDSIMQGYKIKSRVEVDNATVWDFEKSTQSYSIAKWRTEHYGEKKDKDGNVKAKGYWAEVTKETCEYTQLQPTLMESYCISIFTELIDQIKFNTHKINIFFKGEAAKDGTLTSGLREEPYFVFDDLKTANKYLTWTWADEDAGIIDATKVLTASAKKEDIPSSSVTVVVNLVINDKWGKTTIVPIDLILSTK